MTNDLVIETKFLQPRSKVMTKKSNPCQLDQMGDKKVVLTKKSS